MSWHLLSSTEKKVLLQYRKLLCFQQASVFRGNVLTIMVQSVLAPCWLKTAHHHFFQLSRSFMSNFLVFLLLFQQNTFLFLFCILCPNGGKKKLLWGMLNWKSVKMSYYLLQFHSCEADVQMYLLCSVWKFFTKKPSGSARMMHKSCIWPWDTPDVKS